MHTPTNKGITMIEFIIVIAIIGVIAGIVMPSLSTFRRTQALRNATEEVVSLLNKARTDTLASLNSTNYSVRFESTRAVYFVGTVFTDGLSTNKVVSFGSLVTLPPANISLNGGVTTVTFTRLTGDTTAYGTITLQQSSDATLQKIITINKTGLVSAN
jgi:prepilin-type N-terminal cleavage/methylation domain-containing protein